MFIFRFLNKYSRALISKAWMKKEKKTRFNDESISLKDYRTILHILDEVKVIIALGSPPTASQQCNKKGNLGWQISQVQGKGRVKSKTTEVMADGLMVDESSDCNHGATVGPVSRNLYWHLTGWCNLHCNHLLIESTWEWLDSPQNVGQCVPSEHVLPVSKLRISCHPFFPRWQFTKEVIGTDCARKESRGGRLTIVSNEGNTCPTS